MNSLSKLLKEKKVSRLDLHFLAGTSFITIYGIEKHNYKPRAEICERIAKVLGVNVEDIWPKETERS